jgi:hypothetical protein
MKKLKQHAGEIAFIAVFLAVLITGFYIEYTEVDQKPSPRALYNLGVHYNNVGRGDIARAIWGITVHYNELYGTNWQPHHFPDGRCIERAKRAIINTTIVDEIYEKFKDDDLFRRGRD